MDDNYQTYLNRVARMTLPATYQSQLPHIHQSPKFAPHPDGGRKAVPFPGYTVVTPPWEEESENEKFYKNLQDCQAQLLQQLDPGLLIPVPPESFHLTLADLIWSDAYRHANENPSFESKLRDRIAESFEMSQRVVTGGLPIVWQLLGLMVMTRALVVCLVPKDENSYDRIVQFRRAIYQNAGLMALGIEQQYHFTGHITLGYFGEILPDLNRDRITHILSEINLQWLDTPQEFWVRRAELRKFDDMTRYYREPDWPVLEF